MISSNGIRWNAIRAWCNIIRLYAVAIVVLNGIASSISAIADHNTWCTIKAILQIVTDQTEVWQTHPACFYCTRTRHTMAFTFLTHLTLNMLKREKKTKKHIFINKSNSKRFYLQDETAKNWHYSCIKRKEGLCSVSLFVYSCRVHKIKIHIYNISTARNVFISLELHYFHVHNSIKRTNKTKKQQNNDKTERWWVHYKKRSLLFFIAF